MKAIVRVVGLLLLASCGKDATGPAPVTTVRVEPLATNSMFVGDSLLVTAITRNAAGGVVAGRPLTWTSSDPSLATVRSTTGNAAAVVALKAGNVTITVASEGKSDRFSLTMTGPVATIAVTPSEVRLVVGDVAPISVILMDENKNVVPGRPVAYVSSNPNVAIVSATGNVAGVSVGSCTVTATSDGKSAAATIVVVPPPPPPAQHAFLWTTSGGVKELAALPGFTGSYAMAINSRGQVVGGSTGRDGTNDRTHAVLWSPSGILQDLGTLPGGANSEATAINALGQIAGSASISTGSNAPTHAVLWSPTGVMRDLGTLPGDVVSSAYGINDAGQVVGASYGILGAVHAFAWTESGGMVNLLRNFSLANSYAYGINRAGDIVGSRANQPFSLSMGGVIQDFPLVMGDGHATAYAVNDAGDAAGWSDFENGRRTVSYYPGYVYDLNGSHAVRWSKQGGALNLGALPGFNPLDSRAYGLNNRGLVVGQSGGRAFLWSQAGGFVNLGALIGRFSSVARGVNDAGQVVGYGR